MLPIQASSTYRAWLEHEITITAVDDTIVYATYFDTAIDSIQFRYHVDRHAGVVRKLEKFRHYSGGYVYQMFNGTFLYDDSPGGFPVLRAMALNDDTTLQHGGYRFFDIEYNIPLDDSLFVPNRIVRDRRTAYRTSPPAPASRANAREFDLLGRFFMPADWAFINNGIRIVLSGENRGTAIIRVAK